MLQTAVNTVTPDFLYLSPPQSVVSGSGFTVTMGFLLLMHANKDRVIWNGEWHSTLWTQSDTENSTTKLLFYGFNLRYFLLERAEVQLQPFFMNKNWTRQCLQIQKEWKTTAYVSNSCITCQIFKKISVGDGWVSWQSLVALEAICWLAHWDLWKHSQHELPNFL